MKRKKNCQPRLVLYDDPAHATHTIVTLGECGNVEKFLKRAWDHAYAHRISTRSLRHARDRRGRLSAIYQDEKRAMFPLVTIDWGDTEAGLLS